MPSLQQLLSKKSDSGPVAVPAWHPNFRNFERLPDTKVVRTTFFINAAAATVAVGVAIWAGYQELQIRTLSQQIAESTEQIESNNRQNGEAIRLSGEFAAAEKKVLAADQFAASPMAPAEFVLLLGETLPKEIAIDFVELRYADTAGPAFVLRGSVTGAPDQAASTASDYLDVFRTHPRFIASVDKAEMTNVSRNPASGFVIFEMVLRMKAPNGKKS